MVLGPLFLLFLFLHLITPSSRSSLSGLRGTSRLPGFSPRSGASRRTDKLHKTGRYTGSAACGSLLSPLSKALTVPAAAQGGGMSAANFSEIAPFTFCPTFGDGDELGQVYGSDAILKTRAHVGSSERIRKVIRRAMAGLPISASAPAATPAAFS